MRNLFGLALLCIMAFSSCNKDASELNDIEPDNNTEFVMINLSPYSMESLDNFTTRAASPISGIVTKLDVWIIEGTDTIEFHQSSGDGFGTISATLNKTKTYTLYAIAHSANGEATLDTDHIVSFPDNKVTQTLFYTTTFSPAETTSITGVMDRISSQFRMETSDAIPNDVTQMKFTVYNTGTTFNVVDKTFGDKIDKVTHYTSINVSNDGTANFTVSLFPNNVTETANFRIVADAMRANNSIFKTREFPSVPIKSNYKTTYRGVFFTDQTFSSSFSVNDWSSFDTTDY